MGRDSKNRDRLNIYLVPELKDYVADASKKFGMTQSAFLTMVIQQYKQNNEALKEFSRMEEYINKISQLKQNDVVK